MPFKSKAQQRFMFAAEDRGELPKGTAKEWADATEKKKGGIEALPEKVKPMKKSAAEIAEKVCTPEEKAKCCGGDGDKNDEKKEDKKPEDTGNPFAKKEDKPEDKKEEKPEDKGNPFAKKTAAQIAYTVLKTAAVPEGGYTDEQLHPANVAMSAMGRGLTGMAGGAGLGMLLGRLLGGRGASKMFPHIKGRGEADRIAANEVAKRLRLASKGPGKKFTVAPPSQLERDAGDYLGHIRRRIGQGAVAGGALGAITGAGRGAYGAAPMKEGPFLYPLGVEENDSLEQYLGKNAACASHKMPPKSKIKKKSPQDIANKVWTSKKK